MQFRAFVLFAVLAQLACSQTSTGDLLNGDFIVKTTPLEISPRSITVDVKSSTQFTAKNGTPPYTFSIPLGEGSITQEGAFTAGASISSALVTVTDQDLTSSNALVSITATTPPSVSSLVSQSGLATDLTVDDKFNIVFSAEMTGASVNAQSTDGGCSNSVQLSRNDFTSCEAATISTSDNVTFEVNSARSLLEGATYKVRVTSGVQGITGLGMLTDYTTTGFTTWSPADLGGIIFWLKSTSLSLNNNDGVASWSDSSGQGNTASQGSSSLRPTFKTNVANGNPIVRFDGTNDQLTNNFLWTEDTTLFVVSTVSTGSSRTILASDGTNEQPALRSNFSASEAFQWYTHSGVVTKTQSFGASVGSGLQVVSLLELFSADGNNSNDRLHGYLNGILRINQNSYGNWWFKGSSRRLKFIGSASAGNYAAIDLAEIIVFNTDLSLTNIRKVECYLGDKYGVAISGHTCP